MRRKFALGFAGAAAAHWLGNFPISLMAWNVGHLGKTAWMVNVQCWLMACFLAAAALLTYFVFGRPSLGLLFYGRRHCPECHADYDPPLLFALNFGTRRYERCPHCRRWHWT